MRNDDTYNKEEALDFVCGLVAEGHGTSYAQRVMQLKYDISLKEIYILLNNDRWREVVKKKNEEKNKRHKKFLTAKRVEIRQE